METRILLELRVTLFELPVISQAWFRPYASDFGRWTSVRPLEMETAPDAQIASVRRGPSKTRG